MEKNLAGHSLIIQDSGAPRGERNHWEVVLNGVVLYSDYNGKKANQLFDAVESALTDMAPKASQQPKLGLAEGDRPGYDALWLWFGMSSSSYAVLPRVMMHEMPDAWQADFARLMDQWDETWVNQPNIGTRVRVVDDGGQLIKTPNWMLNYRHPDREQLNSMRKKP